MLLPERNEYWPFIAKNRASLCALWVRSHASLTTCGIARAMRDDYSFLLSVRECLDRHCRGN